MKILLYRLIQLTWGLPQSLLGFLLYLRYLKAPHEHYKGAIITRWPRGGGVSLGMFSFVEANGPMVHYIRKHEYGHSIQSLMLGPFYLFLVGIPSLIWARVPYFVKRRERRKIAYNSFIVEKSADRLGGNR